MLYHLAAVVLYVLGVVWCVQVVRKFGDDVREIREVREAARTAAIIFIWLLTVAIAVAVILHTPVMFRAPIELVRVFTG